LHFTFEDLYVYDANIFNRKTYVCFTGQATPAVSAKSGSVKVGDFNIPKKVKGVRVKAVIIVFETKTNTVYCECNKLQLELAIFKGISKHDFENKTDMLMDYLSKLDFYSKDEF